MRRLVQLALVGSLTLAAGTSLVGTAHADDYWWNRDRDNGRYGWFDRGWWGRSDSWKERRYERRMDNDRPGDAARLNNRLCHNGIPGDAPADC